MSGLNEAALYNELNRVINSDKYKTLSQAEQVKELYKIADLGSIHTSGKVTVLYSGYVDGLSGNNIANSMSDVRIIDNTDTAKFLASDNFKSAYLKTAGFLDQEIKDALDARAPRDTPAAKYIGKLYHGTDGPWAATSKRFVDATVGDVRIVTSLDANSNGVFALTEYDALRNNKKITSVNGYTHTEFLTRTLEDIQFDAHVKLRAVMQQSSGQYLRAINNYASGDLRNISATDLEAIQQKLAEHPASKKYMTKLIKEGLPNVMSKAGPAFTLVGVIVLLSDIADAEAKGDRSKSIEIVEDFTDEAVGGVLAGGVAELIVGSLLTKLAVTGGVLSLSPFWAGAAIVVTAFAAGYAGSKYIGLITKPIRNWISNQPEFIEGMDWLYNISGVEQVVEKNGKTYFLFSYLNNAGDRQKNFKDFSALMKGFGSEYIIDNLYKLIFNETPSNFENSYIKINNFLRDKLKNNELYTLTAFSRETDFSNDSLAYRYALVNGGLFAVDGIDYSQHNQNGELDSYNFDTHKGMLTENYLKDRANYLQMLIDNESSVSQRSDYVYYDAFTKNKVTRLPTGSTIEDRTLVIFGTNNGDSKDELSFTQGAADTNNLYIYAGDGDDALVLKAKNNSKNHLEGGADNDTYDVNGLSNETTMFDIQGDDVYQIKGKGTHTSIDVEGTDKYLVEDFSGKYTMWIGYTN